MANTPGPSTQRARIRRLLRAGPLTTPQIADALGLDLDHTGDRLRELLAVDRVEARWTRGVRLWALRGRLRRRPPAMPIWLTLEIR